MAISSYFSSVLRLHILLSHRPAQHHEPPQSFKYTHRVRAALSKLNLYISFFHVCHELSLIHPAHCTHARTHARPPARTHARTHARTRTRARPYSRAREHPGVPPRPYTPHLLRQRRGFHHPSLHLTDPPYKVCLTVTTTTRLAPPRPAPPGSAPPPSRRCNRVPAATTTGVGIDPSGAFGTSNLGIGGMGLGGGAAASSGLPGVDSFNSAGMGGLGGGFGSLQQQQYGVPTMSLPQSLGLTTTTTAATTMAMAAAAAATMAPGTTTTVAQTSMQAATMAAQAVQAAQAAAQQQQQQQQFAGGAPPLLATAVVKEEPGTSAARLSPATIPTVPTMGLGGSAAPPSAPLSMGMPNPSEPAPMLDPNNDYSGMIQQITERANEKPAPTVRKPPIGGKWAKEEDEQLKKIVEQVSGWVLF